MTAEHTGRQDIPLHSANGPDTHPILPFLTGLLCAFLLPFAALAADIPDLTDGFTPPEIAPGSPAGSYPLSGFDTISPYSGRINFALPLRQAGGRGEVGHAIYLRIDQPWIVDRDKPCDTCSETQDPVPTWWSTNYVGYGPGIVEGRNAVQTIEVSCGGSNTERPEYTLRRITFIGPGGSEIELRDTATNGEPKYHGPDVCTFKTANRGTVFVAADGSGATFVSNSTIYDSQSVGSFYPDGELYFPDGRQYHIVEGLVEWIRDRNGNRIEFEYNDLFSAWRVTTIKDSLNRTTTIQYDISCSAGQGCDRIQFKGFNGTTRTVDIHYEELEDRLVSGTKQKYSDLFPELNVSNTQFHNPRVVSKVVLPNSKDYAFKYNEYGELAWMRLPTGGRTEYDWVSGTGTGGGGVNGSIILRRVEERRTYLNETTSTKQTLTTFTRSDTTNCQPLGGIEGSKAEVKHFNSAGSQELAIERHYYCGVPGDSADLDSTDYGSWKTGREYKTERMLNASTVGQTNELTWEQRPSVGESIWWGQLEADDAPPNDPRLTVSQQTAHDATPDLVAKQEFEYDQYNNRTDIAEYDYNGSTPIRRAHFELKTDSSYLNTPVHLRRLVTKQWICGAGTGNCTEGAAVAKTEYLYDGTSLTNRSNMTGHDSGFGTSYTTRGNITKVRKWRDLPSSKWIETTLEYDIAGNVVKITDPKSNVTTAAYTDDFSNGSIPELTGAEKTFAFPTSLTRPLSQTVSAEFDYYLGQITTFTDQNAVETTYDFTDSLDRIKAVTVADNVPGAGPGYDFTYDDTAPNPTVEQSDNIDRTTKIIYDGLGREVTTQNVEDDAGSGTCIKTTRSYDPLGRVEKVTNPYRESCITLTVTPSGDLTTTAYDWLGRATSITKPGSAQSTTTYAGNETTATDQAGKIREATTDALGRLIKVIEDPGGLNYNTEYTYNVLDKLTQVMQEGNGATQQFRNFTYDSLGRLLSADNPEDNGDIDYEYDDDGNLTKKTDARAISTNLVYDALNRLIEKNYTTGAGVTPTARYCYDGKHYDPTLDQCITPSPTLSYAVGRLTGQGVEGWTATNHTSLDGVGRPLASTQSTASVYQSTLTDYSFAYTYHVDGSLKTQQYPSGKTLEYRYDLMRRPMQVFEPPVAVGPHYVESGAERAPHGGPELLPLGNGLVEQTCYNNRHQPVTRRLGASEQSNCANSGSDPLHLSFGYGSASSNNGNLLSQTIVASGYTLNQYYGYDETNRLKIAVEGATIPQDMTCPTTTSWCREYDYDHFGNRWVSSNLSMHMAVPTSQSAYQATTNRLTAASYDNAGNMTAHPHITTGSGSITYDANNLIIEFTATGVTAEYAYDAQGRRVAKTVNGEVTIYVYDVRGRLAAEYTTETPWTAEGVYYRTTDHLGSTRVITDDSGQVKQRRDFFPFGEEIPADSSHGNRNQIAGYNVPLGIHQQFTGQQRDTESGLDYFWARNFSGPLGRFLSVDPASAGAGAAFPQSWNAYGYVVNNPLKFFDPDGRECQYAVEGVPCFDVTTTGGSGELPATTHFDSFEDEDGDGEDPRGYDAEEIAQFEANRVSGTQNLLDGTLWIGLDQENSDISEAGFSGALRILLRLVGRGVGLSAFAILRSAPHLLRGSMGPILLRALDLTQLKSLVSSPQKDLLRAFFGNTFKGAQGRLANFQIPQGLTREALIVYREAARRVVDRGPTAPGYNLQRLRLELVDKALQQLP